MNQIAAGSLSGAQLPCLHSVSCAGCTADASHCRLAIKCFFLLQWALSPTIAIPSPPPYLPIASPPPPPVPSSYPGGAGTPSGSPTSPQAPPAAAPQGRADVTVSQGKAQAHETHGSSGQQRTAMKDQALVYSLSCAWHNHVADRLCR